MWRDEKLPAGFKKKLGNWDSAWRSLLVQQINIELNKTTNRSLSLVLLIFLHHQLWAPINVILYYFNQQFQSTPPPAFCPEAEVWRIERSKGSWSSPPCSGSEPPGPAQRQDRERAVPSAPPQYNDIFYLEQIEAIVTNIWQSNVSLGIVKSSEHWMKF